MRQTTTSQDHEALLERILTRIAAGQRETLRELVRSELCREAPDDPERAQRYLLDLDIYLGLSGPEFMYARGIAETLRVGEGIFELAYALRRGMA